MISQKTKASARMLGFGLLAVAVSAPVALAQAITAQCPFTSTDIDDWYTAIGFNTVADRASTTCAYDSLDYVTLGEIERKKGVKDFNGQAVTGLVVDKNIMIDLQADYRPDGTGTPRYSIMLTRDGSPIADTRAGSDIPLSGEQYRLCVSELLNSQAWNVWACGNQ